MTRLTDTVPEAQLLGFSRTSAYDCVRRGEIPEPTLGRRIVVNCSASSNSSGHSRPSKPLLTRRRPAMSDLNHGTATDHHGLNDAAIDTVDKSHTDLPVPQGEPADDNTAL